MAIITTQELTTFLDLNDNEDQSRIAVATAAANEAITDYCGRVFDKTATGSASPRVFRVDNGYCCTVHDFWETSVLAVRVDFGDDGTFEQLWTLNTDYYLEPLNGLMDGQPWPYSRIRTTLNRTFPAYSHRPAVQVTAAWGWASIPDVVKQSTLIKAGKLYRRKDSLDGVLGGFADFTAVRISSREDPDIVSMLQSYRRPAVAMQIA